MKKRSEEQRAEKHTWELPSYINEKGNVARLVIFTAVFAMFFLNLYQPFNSGTWAGRFGLEDGDSIVYFLYSSLVILAGLSVIGVTRTILHFYSRKHKVSVIGYVGIILLEIVLMAMIFASFKVFVLERFNKINVLFRLLVDWADAVKKTSMVLLIPYTIMWLYFALREKTLQVNILRAKHRQRNKMMPRNEMICFYDEKGDLRLSIDKNSLYYIESADNYVKIYYKVKGKLQHFMLRNSMKSIDEHIGDRLMMRCHRSYMVNLDKVKVLRKSEDGLILDLDHEQIPDIPVSKTYSARVMDRFTSHDADVDIEAQSDEDNA